jgi:transposase
LPWEAPGKQPGASRDVQRCRGETDVGSWPFRQARARERLDDRRWSRSSCESAHHPEQGFRACVGILRFARTYGTEQLEAACARALQIGARSYSSVKSILKNDLDRRRPEPATDGPAIVHANIRGPTYFH